METKTIEIKSDNVSVYRGTLSFDIDINDIYGLLEEIGIDDAIDFVKSYRYKVEED